MFLLSGRTKYVPHLIPSPSGIFGLLQFRFPRTLGNNLLHFSWTLATVDNIFRLAWQPNNPCLASGHWPFARSQTDIYLIVISPSFRSTSQNKNQHQRKNKIDKKPQGASIESTTHMVQWQLGERDASKMPVPLNRKMIWMKNTKQWTEYIKEEWKLWNKAFEVMGLGSQQLYLHDQASVASAPCFGVHELSRARLSPDFPSALTAAPPSTAQGRQGNPGFCLPWKRLECYTQEEAKATCNGNTNA